MESSFQDDMHSILGARASVACKRTVQFRWHRIGLTAILLSGCAEEISVADRRACVRPAVVNRERVVEWELHVNGVPFEGHHHVLELGKPVAFTGRLVPKDKRITWRLDSSLRLVLRPQGEFSMEEDWTTITSEERTLELEAWFSKPETIDCKTTHPLRNIEPGEYNARLCFLVLDNYRENQRTTVDLLATGTVTIVAAAED
jgi:hypothetical protein